MDSNTPYNYTKIFFRRPIWTEANVRMLIALLISAVLTLGLTVSAVRYFNDYPQHQIQRKLKEGYIARIGEIYRHKGTVKPAEPYEQNAAILNNPRELSTAPAQAPASVVDELIAHRGDIVAAAESNSPRQRNFPGLGSAEGERLAEMLADPDQTSIQVRNAIENIPALVVPSPAQRLSALEPYNARRKAYESNVQRMQSGTDGEAVTIPEVEFTDFEIIRGYRNQEETIAVANQNMRSVKTCVKRFHRYDPTMRGQVLLKFNVHPEGYVIPESIKIVKTDIRDIRLLNCIKRDVARWRNFPPVAYEMGEYAMTQKFIF